MCFLIANQRARAGVSEPGVSRGADDGGRGLEWVIRLTAGNGLPERVAETGRQQGHVVLRVAVTEVAYRGRGEGVGPGAHDASCFYSVVAGEARLVSANVAVERVRNGEVAPVRRIS